MSEIKYCYFSLSRELIKKMRKISADGRGVRCYTDWHMHEEEPKILKVIIATLFFV